MKGVQCYELFGGIALKIHTFSFHFHILASYQSFFCFGVETLTCCATNFLRTCMFVCTTTGTLCNGPNNFLGVIIDLIILKAMQVKLIRQ